MLHIVTAIAANHHSRKSIHVSGIHIIEIVIDPQEREKSNREKRMREMRMRKRESTHASAHSTASSSRSPHQARSFITSVPPSTPTTAAAATLSLAHTKLTRCLLLYQNHERISPHTAMTAVATKHNLKRHTRCCMHLAKPTDDDYGNKISDTFQRRRLPASIANRE
jgi:hypothetical protein